MGFHVSIRSLSTTADVGDGEENAIGDRRSPDRRFDVVLRVLGVLGGEDASYLRVFVSSWLHVVSSFANGNRSHGRASLSPHRLCTLTPSRRTGRRPASVRSSSCTARETMSASSRVGGAVWLRVTVVKSEYRTLIVTVRAISCRCPSHRAASPAMA